MTTNSQLPAVRRHNRRIEIYAAFTGRTPESIRGALRLARQHDGHSLDFDGPLCITDEGLQIARDLLHGFTPRIYG